MVLDKKKILSALGFILIAFAIFFFSISFSKNIGAIQNFKLKLSYPHLSLAIVLFIFTDLLAAYSWKYLISFHVRAEIPFSESIAVFNASRVASYIPGFIWGYGILAHWLDKYGGSKFLTLYASLMLLICNLLVALPFFPIYFFLNFDLPIYYLALLLLAIVLSIVIFTLYSNGILNYMIKKINSIFKAEIHFYPTTPKIIFFLLLQYAINYICFGIGGYLLSIGIGIAVEPRLIFNIITIMGISDVIGLIVIIAPGGLGVRENIMLFALNKISLRLALILPVAVRIMTMTINILLTLGGMLFYRKYFRGSPPKSGDIPN